MATGVGVAVSPSFLGRAPFGPPAGMLVWLDASTLTLALDDPVPQLTDQSGNARHFANDTAGQRPLYKPTAFGGKPAVRFDGTDDALFSTGDFSSLAERFTFLAAVSLATNTNSLFDSAPSAANTFRFLFESAELHAASPYALITASASTPLILSVTGTSTRTLATWINGAAHSSEAAAEAAIAWTTPYIATINAGTHTHFAGDLAELLIYATADATTRQAAETYLLTKYGL